MTRANRSARPRAAAKRYGGHETVDDYLAALPKDVRDALGRLRKTIKAAAPKATDGISYQVPVFKLDADRSSVSARPLHIALSSS